MIEAKAIISDVCNVMLRKDKAKMEAHSRAKLASCIMAPKLWVKTEN